MSSGAFTISLGCATLDTSANNYAFTLGSLANTGTLTANGSLITISGAVSPAGTFNAWNQDGDI